jgi:CDP-diacylglycerol pyrophosphatase
VQKLHWIILATCIALAWPMPALGRTVIVLIERKFARMPNATNYFDNAWEARTYINEALHKTLPRDDIGLAINSAVSRSQDQLDIDFSCIRGDVLEGLHVHDGIQGANGHH